MGGRRANQANGLFVTFFCSALQLALTDPLFICLQLNWRLSHEPIEEDESEEYRDPVVRENTKCTMFLGFTSNMGSTGIREFIRFLAQHKLVSAAVRPQLLKEI